MWYNRGMKKHKRGFTLVEVVLFLAVTVALFVGIASGVQGSIFQQRYNDAVQNYAEFWRSIYSQVSNVQNENTGRSDQAIYGKVVTFRRRETPVGSTEGHNEIKVYNLIGEVERINTRGETVVQEKHGSGVGCSDDGTTIARLRCVNATVLTEPEPDPTDPAKSYSRAVGFVEDYVPRWSSEIQTTDEWVGSGPEGYRIYEGIVIVAHSPTSGNVATYVWDDPAKMDTIHGVIDKIEACDSGVAVGEGLCGDADPFQVKQFDEITGKDWSYLNSDNFRTADIDFCVNPNGYEFSNVRRNIRLSEGAHNASGVDVLTEDRVAEGAEATDKDHNRCR